MSASASILIIELYDIGVRVCDAKNILADSVSCALIEADKSILAGEQAEHQAHLRPRECSTQFWNKLSENSDTKHKISNAEIAYHHLKSVWESANRDQHNVILITPVTLDKHALGLLLGICKKLSINVIGMVSNATLAMRKQVEGCQAAYLDLLQKEIAITELIQSDTGITLKQPSHIVKFGLDDFMHRNAKAIANRFTSETRFDPLHSAEDEQQFFDKLPLWLTSLDENESIECKLNKGEKTFAIQIDNEYLQTTNKKLFEEIAAHLNVLFHSHELVAIFCSSSCKRVFGLPSFLYSLPGCAVEQLNKSSLAEQAMMCKEEIVSDGQIHYVNSLGWNKQATANELDFSTGRLSNLSNTPTHLLINGCAYSLQKDIFIANSDTNNEPRIVLENNADSICKIHTNKLNVEIKALNNQVVNLNQQQVTSFAAATIGDELTIQGCEAKCQFIKVFYNEA